MTKSVPASEWRGQRVAVAVRTSIKKTDHYSPWSNRVVLEVIPPLQRPVIKAEATKDGYLLTWPAERPGLHYEVFRQGPNEHTPVQLGTADSPVYVDSTAQWDTPYTYTVVAQIDSAESLPSEPKSVDHPDTFPPAVPASITALAGPASIEISWARSPDADLKGYYVYRSVGGGPLVRLGDLINLPTYSDRSVEHGKTYTYAVSAIDQKGNESAKSAATEPITF